MSIREFFFGPKKMKARDDKVIQSLLGVVYDVGHGDWVEMEFRNENGVLVHHNLRLPGHNLRIGEFVTVTYRRGRELAR